MAAAFSKHLSRNASAFASSAALSGPPQPQPADPARLPRIPARVGVVTSRSGAAYQDILNVLSRRAPYLEVVLADARVQGAGAAASLVRALQRIQAAGVDVVILGNNDLSSFSGWQQNDPRYQDAARIADAVLSGDVPDPTEGATHFLNPDIVRKRRGGSLPAWARGEGQSIGRHTFYAPHEGSTQQYASLLLGIGDGKPSC